jgi:hypothetical protein
MKKLFSVLSILVIVSPLFAQNTNSQFTDYFPLGIGNTWTYANASGKTVEVIIVRNSSLDNVSNDGTSLYLFERQFVGIGTGSTLYSVKQNKVLIMVEKNILGQYQQKSPPFPILASVGQEWRYNDRGDDLRYKTSKSSCAFDGTTFNDCILVEEQIVNGRNVLRTKRSYYAKGVGLVYVTLQEQGESESVYRKLESSNFTNIQEENEEKEEPLPAIQSEKNNHGENEAIQDQNNITETDRLYVTDSNTEHTASTSVTNEPVTDKTQDDEIGYFYLGYSYSPELPFGVETGIFYKKWGGFLQINFDRNGLGKHSISDAEYTEDGSQYYLYGLSASSSIYDGVDSTALKLNIVFGVQYRIFNTLCIRLGIGPDFYTTYHLFIRPIFF